MTNPSAISYANEARLNAFPVFLRVEGRVVVIIGDGEEALAKARLIGQSSAVLRIVSEAPEPDLVSWAEIHGAELLIADWNEQHLADAVMVFAATGDESHDSAISAAARRNNIPVNAVDRPPLCDFYTPALVNRAPVAIAIGTEGAGPVLAQMIRSRIDQMLPPYLGRLASLAAQWRDAVDAHLSRGLARRLFWKGFFNGEPARAVETGNIDLANETARQLLANETISKGHVSLVGAGPGSEDLITLRAHRLLMEADVIVHDALVPEAIIALGRRDAERISAGKRKGCHSKSQSEINVLLVELANEGKRVVRLKCGDPLVFGRAGEEMAALRAAGVSYDVVPGVTSAFAAAADFELPLTLRGVSSSLVFTTGHDLKGSTLPDWAKLAIAGSTVAVYMGRSNAADIAARLAEAGLPSDTAVAVVENASLMTRRMFHGTLADLPALEHHHELDGPVMTIIGDAVAGANLKSSVPLASFIKTSIAA